jgi:replicative DNA helicase
MTKSKKFNPKEDKIFDESKEIVKGKVPPNASELEAAILGAILIDNEVLNDVIQILDYSHFYSSKNATIYQAMTNLEVKNEPIDANTLKEELERLNKLTEVGGIEYIIDLTTSISTSANAEHYARIVFEKYVLRNLISISSKIVTQCLDPTVETFHILDSAEKNILDISESLSKKKIISIKDEIEGLYDELGGLRGKDNKGVTGVPTGYFELDEKTSGFQPSELIIIAGRPSHGKTALAVNIARNAAVDHKKNVLIFSLEMTVRELMIRMLASEARVDATRLKIGRTSNEEWTRIANNFTKLKSNIYIDDSSDLSILELRAKARRFKYEFGIDMIVVDYLQLLRGLDTRYERRDLEVAYVSRSLKALAKELEIPVVACAQLNRGIEQRGKIQKPQLSDLRESGSIEQDADVVIFVHRQFLIEKKDPTEPDYEELRRKSEIVIGKQRNGPTGHFDLVFLSEFTKFENKLKLPDLKIPVEVKEYDQTPF